MALMLMLVQAQAKKVTATKMQLDLESETKLGDMGEQKHHLRLVKAQGIGDVKEKVYSKLQATR